MADMLSGLRSHLPSQGRRSNKLSTRVDLTPMVDLGFLLITFFIFTTTLSQPKALNLIIPADGEGTTTAEHKTLNLVLLGGNKIQYYIGNEVGNRGCTDFSPAGVRVIIQLMQQEVRRRFGNRDETVVLIRPTAESSYMNLIDILDELLIADIKKYALMESAGEIILNKAAHMQPC